MDWGWRVGLAGGDTGDLGVTRLILIPRPCSTRRARPGRPLIGLRQILRGNKWGFQACLAARRASVPVVYMENRVALTDGRPSCQTCCNARMHTRKYTWHLSHYHNVTDLPVSIVHLSKKKVV